MLLDVSHHSTSTAGKTKVCCFPCKVFANFFDLVISLVWCFLSRMSILMTETRGYLEGGYTNEREEASGRGFCAYPTLRCNQVSSVHNQSQRECHLIASVRSLSLSLVCIVLYLHLTVKSIRFPWVCANMDNTLVGVVVVSMFTKGNETSVRIELGSVFD